MRLAFTLIYGRLAQMTQSSHWIWIMTEKKNHFFFFWFLYFYRYGASTHPSDGGTLPVIAILDKLMESPTRKYQHQLNACLKIILKTLPQIEMPYKVTLISLRNPSLPVNMRALEILSHDKIFRMFFFDGPQFYFNTCSMMRSYFVALVQSKNKI